MIGVLGGWVPFQQGTKLRPNDRFGEEGGCSQSDMLALYLLTKPSDGKPSISNINPAR